MKNAIFFIVSKFIDLNLFSVHIHAYYMSIFSRILSFAVLFLLLIALQSSVLVPFINFLKKKNLFNKKIKLLFWILIAYFNLPFIYLIIFRLNINQLPLWLYNAAILPFYIYQSAMLFTGLLFVIYHIIRSPYLLFRILIRKRILIQSFTQ